MARTYKPSRMTQAATTADTDEDMIIISIVNSKGGVGKTTLTASLGVEAAKEQVGVGSERRPAKVALIDLDPQRSLIKWHGERPEGSNPELMTGVENAYDAVDALAYHDYDFVIIDSPPAFLSVIESCVDAADLVVLPLRASMLDIAATEDAYVMALDAGKDTLMVLNDVHPNEGIVSATQDWLHEQNIALAQTMVHHRVAHTYALMSGATAGEKVNGKLDKAAKDELAALWAEVRDAARAAHAKRKEAA